MHGNFTWIDLSTFDLMEAKRFYGELFQWDFTDDGSGYVNCSESNKLCAGLYEMPEFFQKIKMPSFWMTYISVSNIDAVVAKARACGGKVELEEQNSLGKVALIRDPAGAGFTCYEGTAEPIIEEVPCHGRWCWSELFVSDFSKVKQFYAELFDWSFVGEGDVSGRYAIVHASSQRIGAVQVADNEVKGEKEFWGVSFGVRDVDRAIEEVQHAGGAIIDEYENLSGKHYLVNDSQGAAFFMTSEQMLKNDVQSNRGESPCSQHLKWRSFLGLIMIYLAIVFEVDWLWGLLFLFWVIPDLKNGVTYFIEPLSRNQNPFLYWTVVLTWMVLSVYLLMSVF